MAVQLVTKINRYIGTAAEIAALTLTGIPVGSTFFEADTGILKTLSAAGTLVVAPSETVALAAGTALAGKFVPVDTDGDEKFTSANPANVQLSGSKPAKVTTIVNAQTVAAGTYTGYKNLGCDGTESEVWLAISIDKQPWSIIADNYFGTPNATTILPPYYTYANTHTLALPALTLYMGVVNAEQGVSSLLTTSTFNDRKQVRLPAKSDTRCLLTNNHATDAATVTIKVIRIWR